MRIGMRINAKTLIARWGFGEFRSHRWAAHYAAYNPQFIRQGISFDQLTQQEVDHLEHMTLQFRSALASDVHHHSIWECQEWNKDRLGRVLTIVRMAPDRQSNIPFLSFLACPRFLNPNGTPEEGDPRTEADKVPFNTPFQQGEPLVVTPKYGPDILIDGYGRGVLFMRAPNPDALIKVWYPA
jgi:hypothetical protein